MRTRFDLSDLIGSFGVGILSTLLAISIISLYLPGPPAAAPPVETSVSPTYIKKAHAYHGILHSFQAEDGNYYFMRNGERCTLLRPGVPGWEEYKEAKNVND